MSAADNSPNLSNSSTDVHEDELLTWLQYPADDAFERNYCSNSFGGVPSPPNAVVAKTHSCDAPSDVGINTCTGSGSSKLPVKKNVGTKSFSRPSSKAEDALALGAARAAGHSSQMGHDAFHKVRTSLQPHAIFTTPACSSLKANHKDSPVLKPKMPVPYASKRAHGGVESPRLHMANSFSSMEKSKHAPSVSVSLAMEKSGEVRETYSQQLMQTQQCRWGHITEETSNGRFSVKYASSHSSMVPLLGNAKANGATATISNPFNVKGKMGWPDQTSETLPSYSGGSQTSMSLSFREVTYGGKRKHEVSELRSEDAGDKMRDAKVPCKSSSRRNRVSEVHNLSERNRRNRINEKLKALQDLIPNSSKTDKASMLDEAIEYMKTLQLQLQLVAMRNTMNMTPVMMPMAYPPTPMRMAPLHSIGIGVPIGHAGLGMGLGVGMNMDMGLLPQSGRAAPFQPAPAGMTQYGMLLERGNTASLHDSSQACINAGLFPAHPLASMQKMHEPSEHMHSKSLGSPYAHQCQQQEQGQNLRCPFLDHEHEQQDGLSD